MSIWKVILATLVIFSSGAITGVLVSRSAAPAPEQAVPHATSTNRPSQRFGSDRIMRRDFIKRCGDELALTAEQTTNIEAILCASQQRTRELWEKVAPQMREEFHATQEQIHQVLTPEQQSQFDELMKKRHRPKDRDRKEPPPGPPPPDGPGPSPEP